MKPFKSFRWVITALCVISVGILVLFIRRSTNTVSIVAPPNAFTSGFSALSSLTSAKLVEQAVFTNAEHSGPVTQVAYASDTNTVLAVYSEDGHLVGWDANTGKLLSEYDLGIVSTKALEFSTSGQLLMGATAHLYKPNKLNQITEYVNGIALWDTNTGKPVTCISYPCQGEASNQIVGDLGAIIDSKGQWVFTYSEGSLGILDLSNPSGQAIILNDPESDYRWSLGAIAYDETHRRHSLIFQEGRIQISTGLPFFLYRTLTSGTQKDVQDVFAAKFDPAGHWLAFIRGARLSVWQMDRESQYLESDVFNPVALSFDRSGTLLLVGAGNKISIWGLENKSVTVEYEAPGITSLDISEDNRLLVWGDDEGAVHLWGVQTAP